MYHKQFVLQQIIETCVR